MLNWPQGSHAARARQSDPKERRRRFARRMRPTGSACLSRTSNATFWRGVLRGQATRAAPQIALDLRGSALRLGPRRSPDDTQAQIGQVSALFPQARSKNQAAAEFRHVRYARGGGKTRARGAVLQAPLKSVLQLPICELVTVIGVLGSLEICG